MNLNYFLIFLTIALLPREGLLKEYGEGCDSDAECIPKDYLDPLTCIISGPPGTEDPVTDNAIQDEPFEDLRSELFNDYLESQSDPLANGICGCHPNMIRDPDLNRCVSPPKGPCTYASKPPGQLSKTCSKFALCYPNSAGEEDDGICYCDTDATLVLNDTACRLTYGSEKCEKPNDCDTPNLLTCNNGTCVCLLEGMQRWNAKEGKCGYIAGASCTRKPPFPEPVCVENAECTNEVCLCSGNFTQTPEGECKVGFSGDCTRSSDCLSHFLCANSKCICPSGQTYYESTGRCHLPVGSSCEAQDACVLQSECKNGTCECLEGYEAVNNATCHALYDSSCSEEIPCLEDKYFLGTCDTSLNEPTCQCKANYNYDTGSLRCVGNLEEACNIDEDCMKHAICHQDRCKCGGTLLPGEDKRSCFTTYGESCSEVGCYTSYFLKCDSDNAVCTCAEPEDQTYDDTTKHCVALEGRPCASSGQGIQCVGNSTCLLDNNDTSLTKCRCDKGFSGNSTGFCEEGDSSAGSIRSLINGSFFIFVLFYYQISTRLS